MKLLAFIIVTLVANLAYQWIKPEPDYFVGLERTYFESMGVITWVWVSSTFWK